MGAAIEIVANERRLSGTVAGASNGNNGGAKQPFAGPSSEVAFDQFVRTCQSPVTLEMQAQCVLQLAQRAVLAKSRATDNEGGAVVACVEGNSRDGKS